MKHFYIETYGCQMNEYDTLLARNLLEKENAVLVDDPEKADLILLNTCAVRENAHTKIFHRLQSLDYLRKKGARVGVLGCMAQNLKDELLQASQPVDFIMGPDALRNLPAVLAEAGSRDFEKQAFVQLSREETYEDLLPEIQHHYRDDENRLVAFVAIQRGCDNFCSFCVVPQTRGRERSRAPQSVLAEVTALVEAGFKSVVLLGQNVNSYLWQGKTFSSLIEELLQKTSIERIYFTSPHPNDYPQELIEIMASNPRLANHAHIPLQAGSNLVLERMKRGYTRESFLRLVEKFRQNVPDVFISTDIIVGFPGETREQYLETLEVMELADFDAAFMFAYSERQGTIAQKNFPDDVSEAEKKARLEQMIGLQLERSARKNRAYIGRRVEVMVESLSRKSDRELMGKMLNSRKVVFPLPAGTESANWASLLGKKVSVSIKSASSNTLLGEDPQLL